MIAPKVPATKEPQPKILNSGPQTKICWKPNKLCNLTKSAKIKIFDNNTRPKTVVETPSYTSADHKKPGNAPSLTQIAKTTNAPPINSQNVTLPENQPDSFKITLIDHIFKVPYSQ